jgi:hypothetical protein
MRICVGSDHAGFPIRLTVTVLNGKIPAIRVERGEV